MEAKDLIIGERYVPVSKSVGSSLENSQAWKVGEEQGYIFYKGIDEDRAHIFWHTLDNNALTGDLFLPSDVIPYVEPESKNNVMKHTQGEWKAVRKQGTHIHRIVSNDCQEIADTLMPYGLDENSRSEVVKQAEANAKLIAAAPELLEALQELLSWANIKDGSPSQPLRDKCNSIINKATSNH